jgi:hypothetical protein
MTLLSEHGRREKAVGSLRSDGRRRLQTQNLLQRWISALSVSFAPYRTCPAQK